MTPLQRFIAKRVVFSIITIFIIVFTIFTISRIAGDPVEAYVTTETPPEVIEIIRKQYHLDEPIPIQFIYWLQGVARGDLGLSFSQGEMRLDELIAKTLPLTLELNFYSMAISVPISYWIGSKSAFKKDSWFDHLSRFFAIIGRCLPGFFTGLLILAYLYPKGFIVVDFYWTVRKITGMPTIDAILNLNWNAFVHGFKYLIGPMLTSIIGAFAQNTRILRSSILEEMSKDYVKTGKSKGLSTNYVNTKYARRNALIPFTTSLGYNFAWILSGNAVLESVFNRRGMGNVAAQAARMTDHNTLQAFAIIMATLLVTINLIVDIVYGYIDPRIKYGE